MPSSPGLAHSGLGVVAAVLLVALVASLLTLIASAIVVRRYRRAVDRLMMARADSGDRLSSAPVAAAQWHRASPEAIDGDCLYRRALAAPRRLAARYVLAGLAFTVPVAGAAFIAYSQLQMNHLAAAAHPFQLLFLLWMFAWPIVLTVNIVAAGSRRNRWMNVGGYFLVLAMLIGLVVLTPTEPALRAAGVTLPAWAGESPGRLGAKWALFNVAPTLLLVLFRRSRVRTLAPLLLGFMTIVAAGVLGVLTAAFVYRDVSVGIVAAVAERFPALGVAVVLMAYLMLLGLAAAAVFSLLGWLLLAWIRKRYLAKKASDQSLSLDALWLIFATFYAVLLAAAGPGWALAIPAGFVLYKLALYKLAPRAGLRRLRAESNVAPAGLLVLRVFSLGERSEALFDAIARRWRHIGSVDLIAGPDLALSTLTPHRFLAFVSRKLDRLFVRDASSLERSVFALDGERDADGRFRINDFFCHDDTWQGALAALIARTRVVLMDLRSLSASNAGCAYEIRELLNRVPVERLVFVVDATTDRDTLDQTWVSACRELAPDSPNRGMAASSPRPLFELAEPGHAELQELLRRLCTAAASGHAALQSPAAASTAIA